MNIPGGFTEDTKPSTPQHLPPFVGIYGTPENPIKSKLPEPISSSTTASTSSTKPTAYPGFPPYISQTFITTLYDKAKYDLQKPILVEFTSLYNTLYLSILVGIVACVAWMAGYFGLVSVTTVVVFCMVFGQIVMNLREEIRVGLKWENERVKAMIGVGETGESAEWVNFLMSQLWPIIDPKVFSPVIDILEDNFHLFAPPGVTDIRVADFDLGPNAPRLSNFKVLPLASGLNNVVMDCDVSLGIAPYTGVNPALVGTPTPKGGTRVLVYVRVGATQFGTVSVPILVELSQFEAKARIQIELVAKPPFVGTARLTLLSKPTIQFGAKPMKMVNVMNFPVISQVIRMVVDKTVEDLIINPNSIDLNVEQILSGKETLLDTKGIGIIKVTIVEARNLIAADLNGKSDPFVTLDYGGRETHEISSITALGISVSNATKSTLSSQASKLNIIDDSVITDSEKSKKAGARKNIVPMAQTRIVRKSLNPQFHETHYLMVTEDDVVNEVPLRVRVLDFDDLSANDMLGMLDFSVSDIVKQPNQKYVNGWQTLQNYGTDAGKPTIKTGLGELKLVISYHPKIDVKKWKRSTDVIPEPVPKSPKNLYKEIIKENKSGILGLHVHQCADLILDSAGNVEPSAFVEVYCNEKNIFKTRVKAYNSSPFYNDVKETTITNWENTHIRFVVKDQDSERVIGTASIDLGKLLINAADDMTFTGVFFLQNGHGSGKIKASFMFRPVTLNEPRSLGGYPSGVLEIKEIEALNTDLLDPHGKHTTSAGIERLFSRLMIDSSQMETNTIILHTRNPSWVLEDADRFRFHITNRFQTPCTIEVRREKTAGVARMLKIKTRDSQSKLLGIGEFYLGDLEDGLETEIILPVQSKIRRRVSSPKPQGDTKESRRSESSLSMNSMASTQDEDESYWNEYMSTEARVGDKPNQLQYVQSESMLSLYDSDAIKSRIRVVAVFHPKYEIGQREHAHEETKTE